MNDESLSPQLAIECPILDGLADVVHLDGFRTFDICYRSRDLQYPTVRPSAQAEALHRLGKNLLASRIQRAELLHILFRHPRVYRRLLPIEAFVLRLPCGGDSASNISRGRAALGAAQVAVVDGRYIDVDIDAVEQRAGYLLEIALDVCGRAVALPARVGEVSARAPS